MRNRIAGVLLAAAALAGCGGGDSAAPGSEKATNAEGQSVDSGAAPTPALDSVGTGGASDAGRVD